MQFSKLALALASATDLVSAAPTTTGDTTWYEHGLGACGQTNNRNELVVALNPSAYASGSACGRRIRASYQGRTVDATVVDLCPGCGSTGTDLSPVASQKLASLDVGRIFVNLNFI